MSYSYTPYDTDFGTIVPMKVAGGNPLAILRSMMAKDDLIRALTEERDRLESAIDALALEAIELWQAATDVDRTLRRREEPPGAAIDTLRHSLTQTIPTYVSAAERKTDGDPTSWIRWVERHGRSDGQYRAETGTVLAATIPR